MRTEDVTPHASEPQPIVGDPRFRRLLGAKLCVDIADNALAYALLIVIVRRTGSGLHSTLFVIALTLPAIFFGIPAGLLADRLSKRAVLIAALLLRIALTGLLIRVIRNIWEVYGVVLAFAAVGQVFGPVWIASLPRLVAFERLSRAHALLNLTQLGGQVAGVVLIAPIVLKAFGERAVLVVVALFFLGALVISAYMGGLPGGPRSTPRGEKAVRAARAGFFAGWRIIMADATLFMAVIQLTIVASLLRSLMVFFPFYTHQVLGIAPENTVYVAAPAAVGAAVGLALAPLFGFVGRNRLATVGFAVLVGSLACLALVNLLRPFVADRLHLGLNGIAQRAGVPPLVTTAILIAVPMGFGIALNLVAARTVLNERTPEDAQARVFATQSALATVVSLVPLLLVGALTSVIGARPVMLIAAFLAAAAPIALTRRRSTRAVTNVAATGTPALPTTNKKR